MRSMMSWTESRGLTLLLPPERLVALVSAYLSVHRIGHAEVGVGDDGLGGVDERADRAFASLTHRDFCYLSRSRVEVYRERVIDAFRERMERGEPLALFYDLGGGYHASLRPDRRRLFFGVGLGEWFVLSQIGRFVDRLREFYAPGAEFRIVIDNLCAWVVNDIPLSRTSAYVRRFRRLIAAVGLGAIVEVLAESEVLDAVGYRDAVVAECSAAGQQPITEREHANVERFLGRTCDQAEARERVARYEAASRVSDRLLTPWITGPRLTQRASGATLCFRSFPGGDSRIQAGQVGLALGREGRIRPMLLTEANCERLSWLVLDPPPPLPAEVGKVLVGLPSDGVMDPGS